MMEHDPRVSAKTCAHLVYQAARVVSFCLFSSNAMRLIQRSRLRWIYVSSIMADHRDLNSDRVRHSPTTSRLYPSGNGNERRI